MQIQHACSDIRGNFGGLWGEKTILTKGNGEGRGKRAVNRSASKHLKNAGKERRGKPSGNTRPAFSS